MHDLYCRFDTPSHSNSSSTAGACCVACHTNCHTNSMSRQAEKKKKVDNDKLNRMLVDVFTFLDAGGDDHRHISRLTLVEHDTLCVLSLTRV